MRSPLVPPPGSPAPEQESLGSFTTYAEAQAVVEELARQHFEVEQTQIVGTDLRLVEQITGRLDWRRAAGYGAVAGAWFGLFVGLLITFLSGEDVVRSSLAGLGWGAAFGVGAACVRYGVSRGRRDFRSLSATLPTRFEVLVTEAHHRRARTLLGG